MTDQTKQASYIPFVGRTFLAAIFLMSGAGKLAAPVATMDYIAAMGLPFPVVGLAAAIGVELIGGVLLVLGYQTRLAALVLAAFSIVTGLVFHSAFEDQNQMIHLLKNFAMAGGLLQVAAFGAGTFSLDAHRTTRLAGSAV
ncbi:DoxX family protein [Herbaspirillum sp. GCM10030257]|uniref:DoxX family protein n=1 Tax=Herbaspirillum sp. GCM10030257 TaxID=3273393 RepID=UPI003617180D